MRKNYKNSDNYAFLHGFINGIRINPTNSGKTAINLVVATIAGSGERKEYNNHDVSLFTEDAEVVKKYEEIAKGLEANKANKDNQEYKREVFPVEIEGIVVGRENSRELTVLAKPENVVMNPKGLEKGSPANVLVLVGNVADAKVLDEEHKYARVTIGHNFKDTKPFFSEHMVDGRIHADLFEKISSGELGKGDFIRVNGRMEANNYTNAKGEKVYTDQNSVYELNVLKSRLEKRQEEAAKAAKAAKVKEEPKQETKKRRTSKKGM